MNSTAKIANKDIGYMRGHKYKIKEEEDRILPECIVQNAEKDWL